MAPTQQNSAVNPQVNNTLSQISQSQNQRNATNTQAMTARNQQEVQREQMDLQAMMAQDTNSMKMAQVATNAQNEAQNRRFMADKTNLEAQLAREGQQQQASQFREEQDFEKSIYDRQMKMQQSALAGRIDIAKAGIESSQDKRDALIRMGQERDRLTAQIAKATFDTKNQQGSFSDATANSRQQFDQFAQGVNTSVDDVKGSLASELGGERFEHNIATYTGQQPTIMDEVSAVAGAPGVAYSYIMTAGQNTIIGAERRAMIRALGAEDEHRNDLSVIAIPTSFEISGFKGTGETLRKRTAKTIADAIPGVKTENRGAIEAAIDWAARNSQDASPEKLQKIQMTLRKTAEAAGINPMVLTESIIAASEAMNDKSYAYRSAAIPERYTDIDDPDGRIQIPNRDGSPGQDVDMTNAWISSRMYQEKNVVGFRVLAASLDSLEEIESSIASMEALGPDERFMGEAERFMTDYGDNFSDPTSMFGMDDSMREMTDLLGLEDNAGVLERSRQDQDINSGTDNNIIESESQYQDALAQLQGLLAEQEGFN